MTSLTTAPQSPAQSLPRRVKPLPNEVLDAYLGRLGDANGIDRYKLLTLLGGRNGSLRAGLSIAARISDRGIAFALPELRTPADLITYPELIGQPCAAYTGPACPQCASRHGIRNYFPRVWTTHDNVLCTKHSVWLNGPLFKTDTGRPAIALTGAAKHDITLAHQRHQQLITERGRQLTRQAIADAYTIMAHWNFWTLLPSVAERSCELEPDPARRGAGTVVRNAATYPEAVTLAAQLANPRQRRRLVSGPRHRVAYVYAEICMATIGEFPLPNRAFEPLHEWRQTLIEGRDNPPAHEPLPEVEQHPLPRR
ncbi:TniQ family protein [Mycobacteroides abscessus]|uniref:TniQ family protein n=1 Tax=Mycobacteroides abscessus TaxID=36809 RepID=UPI00092AAE66|nr:TniQ family protein [Mycobacteroides abscessus]MDO3333865.1 TniQ family protein [Mycobacteroides abscessus subsp. bolletii]QSM86913.1 TniQ family protein [Mycobacteroides abscessus subsp. bolletii]SIB88126.1 Uncharacterised protein [Mycobacteroides abscessus subsp. bolletii]SIJ25026.1 Uncharacterised protein [Mycobacteroides abscessus subsp. bolletii]SKS89570.1 Uncharacterised protein [Mycobacteroides abscessus subsp. bolletii]